MRELLHPIPWELGSLARRTSHSLHFGTGHVEVGDVTVCSVQCRALAEDSQRRTLHGHHRRRISAPVNTVSTSHCVSETHTQRPLSVLREFAAAAVFLRPCKV